MQKEFALSSTPTVAGHDVRGGSADSDTPFGMIYFADDEPDEEGEPIRVGYTIGLSKLKPSSTDIWQANWGLASDEHFMAAARYLADQGLLKGKSFTYQRDDCTTDTGYL